MTGRWASWPLNSPQPAWRACPPWPAVRTAASSPACEKSGKPSLTTYNNSGPNRSALDIARAAARRDIPGYRVPGASRLLQLGQGRHRQWLDGAAMPDTGSTARMLARDALQTAMLLATHGLPVASPRLARTAEGALQAAAALGWPVALSPRAPGKGVGVSTDISNADELELAFAQAMRYDHSVLSKSTYPAMIIACW
jgi:hypothetical protein